MNKKAGSDNHGHWYLELEKLKTAHNQELQKLADQIEQQRQHCEEEKQKIWKDNELVTDKYLQDYKDSVQREEDLDKQL